MWYRRETRKLEAAKVNVSTRLSTRGCLKLSGSGKRTVAKQQDPQRHERLPQLGNEDELAFRLEANQVWADSSHLFTSKDKDGRAGETPARSGGAVPVRVGSDRPLQQPAGAGPEREPGFWGCHGNPFRSLTFPPAACRLRLARFSFFFFFIYF